MIWRLVYHALGVLIYVSSYLEYWLGEFFAWGYEIRFGMEKRHGLDEL